MPERDRKEEIRRNMRSLDMPTVRRAAASTWPWRGALLAAHLAGARRVGRVQASHVSAIFQSRSAMRFATSSDEE